MIRREAAVIGRMPILRRDDEFELGLKLVDQRNNRVALWHRQRTAGTEIVLKIDQDQRVHRVRDDTIRPMRLRGAIIAAILALLIGAQVRAANPTLKATEPSISDAADATVMRLGDPDPAVREQAEGRLRDMGAAARRALLRGTRHQSPEISSRSREILRSLPWDVEDDPPAVRGLLRNYGERET